MSVWTRLVGQEQVVEVLRRAAADPTSMTHAWLMLGPAGSGRTVAAKAFAAALQCPHGGCDDCAVCRQVFAGTHPEVLTWRTEGLTLKTEHARDLVREVAMASGARGHRVVIVEDADRMHERAANTLLKAVEEPPHRSVWLLCAPSADLDPVTGKGLLPTIRSRCRVVTLQLPSPEAIAGVLVAEGADPQTASFAARAAQGHVGRARRLATHEASRLRRAEVLRLPTRLQSPSSCLQAAADLVSAATEEGEEPLARRDAEETASLKETLGVGVRGVSARGTAGQLKELETEQRSRATRSRRDSLDLALVDLAAFYRDVLTRQLGADVPPVHADQTAVIERMATQSSPTATLRRIEAVLACRDALSTNVAPLLAVEAMTLALRAG